MRFGFGSNWRSFLKTLNDNRIGVAEASLKDMLGLSNLEGMTFLDIGCGSGLFSLCAMRLGAHRVHSFDYDPQSVECARILRQRYFPESDHWTVERGSALDRDYINSLGTYDIVYCWGVLHHTGDMWTALDLVVNTIRTPGGELFLAIYDDQGEYSRYWKKVKENYCKLPTVLRLPYLLYYAVKLDHPVVRHNIHVRKLPWDHWRQHYLSRGMSRWHDIKDWVGGWPYEFAPAEQIIDFYRERGLKLEQLLTGEANNQFLFSRE